VKIKGKAPTERKKKEKKKLKAYRKGYKYTTSRQNKRNKTRSSYIKNPNAKGQTKAKLGKNFHGAHDSNFKE